MFKFKNNTSSIMLSCTLNVSLILISIYFSYLLIILATNNLDTIKNYFNSFILFIDPLINFLLINLNIITGIWAALLFWYICVTNKHNKYKIIRPRVLTYLGVFLFVSSILLSITHSFVFSDTSIFLCSIFTILSFLLIIISFQIILMFIISKQIKPNENKSKQMDLFYNNDI